MGRHYCFLAAAQSVLCVFHASFWHAAELRGSTGETSRNAQCEQTAAARHSLGACRAQRRAKEGRMRSRDAVNQKTGMHRSAYQNKPRAWRTHKVWGNRRPSANTLPNHTPTQGHARKLSQNSHTSSRPSCSRYTGVCPPWCSNSTRTSALAACRTPELHTRAKRKKDVTVSENRPNVTKEPRRVEFRRQPSLGNSALARAKRLEGG